MILLGFNNNRAGRMAPFANARRVGARCGEVARVRASAAAAVRCRAKASGRRVMRRIPRGRVAPAFCCMCQLSCRCCVRGHAPPGARRALRALEVLVEKVVTSSRSSVGSSVP